MRGARFESLIERAGFRRRQKQVQVLDQHQPVRQSNHAAEVLQAGRYARGTGCVGEGRLQHSLSGIDDEHDSAVRTAGNDELVGGVDVTLRQPEPAPEIEDRKHSPLHIYRSQDIGRSGGQVRHLDGAYDALDGRERQGIAARIQGKHYPLGSSRQNATLAEQRTGASMTARLSRGNHARCANAHCGIIEE